MTVLSGVPAAELREIEAQQVVAVREQEKNQLKNGLGNRNIL